MLTVLQFVRVTCFKPLVCEFSLDSRNQLLENPTFVFYFYLLILCYLYFDLIFSEPCRNARLKPFHSQIQPFYIPTVIGMG